MAALLSTACGHRASGDTAEGDSIAADSLRPFMVDSIGLVREDSAVNVRVSIDWPSGSNDSLVGSIRQYICEELATGLTIEGKPNVIIYSDGRTAVDSTVGKHYAWLMSGYQESKSYGTLYDGMQFSYSLRMAKVAETDHYVTYITNSEGFRGGAHGYATAAGQTFRKSDGLRIGYRTEFNQQSLQYDVLDQTLFSNPQSPRLAALIKEGVRSYFQEFQDSTITDDDLLGMLQNVSSVDSIPLPSAPPYFMPQGLCFVYQQYEIACYAAGMINFDISYDKIRPLLTKEASRLIR
jgi:hypothetical protein